MPILEELIAALTSGDDELAEAAVPQIAEMGDAALPALEPLFGAADDDQRWWALRCLAQFDSPPVMPFIEALSDPQLELRQCAAMGLAHHPNSAALLALVGALEDRDSMVATLAANALIALGAESVPALVTVLETGSRAARLEAVRALGAIKDQRAIPALMKAIQQDSALMQYWAKLGLDNLGLEMVYIQPE